MAQEQEGIEDRKSRKLPSIFKLDIALNIPNGTLYRFKKNKQRKRQYRAENSIFEEASFSISYSSDEYFKCSFELGNMEFSFSTEKGMSEYSDNSSDSLDNNSDSSSSFGFFSNDSNTSSDSSSSSSSGSSDSDSGGD